jgi:RimJ/RimL family protein N-acetyltransferase
MERITPRLRVRNFDAADWQAVYIFTADPAVVQWMPLDPPPADDVQAWVQRWITQSQDEPWTSYDVAMVRRQTQQVMGWCRVVPGGLAHRRSAPG